MADLRFTLKQTIFIISLFILPTYIVNGQACGFYRLKYIGEIEAKGIKIQSIRLPSVSLLLGYDSIDSEDAFIEVQLLDGKIEIETASPTTSELHNEPNKYLQIYRERLPVIPFIVYQFESGVIKEVKLELSWDDVKLTKVKDDIRWPRFDLNIGVINL